MIDWIFAATCLCTLFCSGIFIRDGVRAKRKRKKNVANFFLSGVMCLGFAGWTAEKLGWLPRYPASFILALAFVASLLGALVLLHQEMQLTGTKGR